MTYENIDWDDLAEVDVMALEKEFLEAATGKSDEEITKIAGELGICSESILGSSVAKFVIGTKTIFTIGRNNSNLNREQAIVLVGIDAVKRVEKENCEPTNRVGFNGACQDDEKTEWSAATFAKDSDGDDVTLHAYYYTTNDEDDLISDTGDGSSINWAISHFVID